MKKILTLLTLLSVAFAGQMYANNEEKATNENFETTAESLYTCQFSISRSAGRINNQGYTEPFIVKVSCIQTEDVHPTVHVKIDGVEVGSDVYTIKKGKISTDRSYSIKVSSDFIGKPYTLTVD